MQFSPGPAVDGKLILGSRRLLRNASGYATGRGCHDFGHKWDLGKPGRGLDYQTIQESTKTPYPPYLRDIVLVLTVLSLVTWVQDCGWHMRDKILCQRGPFVEFSHEDLIKIDGEYFPIFFNAQFIEV